MKNQIILFLFLLLAFSACEKSVMEKPKNLLDQKEMIDLLVDIHIAEATFQTQRNADTLLRNSTSADFYYSILEKYQVPDSVFEKSFVYYASFPKDFEKMYRKVMNKLSEKEQQYSGRKNDILDIGTPKK